MPFDFMEYKTYSINYKNLFNEVNVNKIFKDKNIQVQYLNRWMDVLKEHDNILVNQLNTPEAILDYTIKVQDEPEIFQLPIMWSKNTIFLHFRISIANMITADYLSKSILTPLDDFTKEDSDIYWSAVDSNVEGYSNANKPILVVPYFNGKYQYLVIDGNHRLTYRMRHNVRDVSVLIISEQSVIDQQLFSSSFDSMYYIFINEINHMGNETAKGECSDMELVQKSFLMGRGYRF